MTEEAWNDIQQPFLEKGAAAAVSRDAVDLSEERTDVLLFATLAQYRAAAAVLLRQPWGLDVLARDILALLEM